MSRWFLVLVIAAPACLNPWLGHHAESSTSGSSGGESSSGEESTGRDESSSTGDSDAGSESEGKTSSTTDDPGETSTSSSTTGESTSTSSTSGPAPYCGDGVVDPDEECDDGVDNGPDAVCNLLCARQRIVFATSEAFSPDLIGGLYFADSLCKQFAEKAGLAHPLSFTAWLSDSKESAGARIFPGKGNYVRPDGVLVARNAEQFGSGKLEAPINVHEWGGEVKGGAWTGTLPDGSAVPGAQHCADWTSDDITMKGHYGHVGVTDALWTYDPNPDVNPAPCFLKMVLYCMEGA